MGGKIRQETLRRTAEGGLSPNPCLPHSPTLLNQNYLEGVVGDLNEHMAKKPPMRHLPIFRLLLRPWPMGAPFLLECKKGILNYVIVRPISSALGLITDMFDMYGQGQINFHKSYVYLAGITNFSQVRLPA
jgi:hypothetical protein